MARNRWTDNRSWRGALAAVAVCTMVACGSDDDARTNDDDVDTVGAGASSVLWEGIIDGVSSTVTEQFLGWALSAIGIGSQSNDAAALDEIASELQEIIDELNDVEDTLEELVTELQEIGCSELVADTTGALASIDTLMDDYSAFVQTAANGSASGTDLLADWADQVLAMGDYSDRTSLEDALEELQDSLVTAPGTDGVIASCVKAITDASPPSAGMLDDRTYYDDVLALQNYYFAYQARGLLMVVEALHYQAWVASGSGSTPSDATSICNAATGDAAVYCEDASTWLTTIYENLVDQFEAGGAPYSTDDVQILNGSTYLWVVSLEDFTDSTAGNSCSSPLTSASPCGVTIGNYRFEKFAVDDIEVRYGGYDSWTPAAATAMEDLLACWNDNTSMTLEINGSPAACWNASDTVSSSSTPASYMESIGFATVDSKIVLSSTTVSTDYGTAVCFFDTSIEKTRSDQPFCSGDGNGSFGDLLGGSGTASDCMVKKESSWLPDTSTNRSFYVAEVGTGKSASGFDVPQCSATFETAGWMANVEEINSEQYHWPVIDVTTLDCIDDRSATNPGGIYTLCGTDFDDWLGDIVAAPSDASGLP